jgi:hypothetical protein
MIETVKEDEKVSSQAERWDERNVLSLDVVECVRGMCDSNKLIIPVDPGDKLGQSRLLAI